MTDIHEIFCDESAIKFKQGRKAPIPEELLMSPINAAIIGKKVDIDALNDALGDIFKPLSRNLKYAKLTDKADEHQAVKKGLSLLFKGVAEGKFKLIFAYSRALNNETFKTQGTDAVTQAQIRILNFVADYIAKQDPHNENTPLILNADTGLLNKVGRKNRTPEVKAFYKAVRSEIKEKGFDLIVRRADRRIMDLSDYLAGAFSFVMNGYLTENSQFTKRESKTEIARHVLEEILNALGEENLTDCQIKTIRQKIRSIAKAQHQGRSDGTLKTLPPVTFFQFAAPQLPAAE